MTDFSNLFIIDPMMEHNCPHRCSIIFVRLHTRIIENDKACYFFEIHYGDAMTYDRRQLITSV